LLRASLLTTATNSPRSTAFPPGLNLLLTSNAQEKPEAKREQEMEQLLADVAENERELRTGRTKEGRGKGEKTGRKAGVRRGGR